MQTLEGSLAQGQKAGQGQSRGLNYGPLTPGSLDRDCCSHFSLTSPRGGRRAGVPLLLSRCSNRACGREVTWFWGHV